MKRNALLLTGVAILLAIGAARLSSAPGSIAPSRWLRHSGIVWSIAFSPDGRRLLSASRDGTIILWDVATGAPSWVSPKLEGDVNAARFSPDGRSFASGGDDGKVRIWETKSGKLKRVLAGHSGPVTSVAFSPNGRTLASGSYDRSILLWDARKGTRRSTIQVHSGEVWALDFSALGPLLSSGSADHSLRFWNLEDIEHPSLGAARERLSAEVWSIAHSPSGNRMAAGLTDGSIQVGPGISPSPAPPTAASRIWGVAWSRESHIVTVGGELGGLGVLQVWDASEIVPVWRRSFEDGATTAVAINPSLTILAVGLETGAIEAIPIDASWPAGGPSSSAAAGSGSDGAGVDAAAHPAVNTRPSDSASSDRPAGNWHHFDSGLAGVGVGLEQRETGIIIGFVSPESPAAKALLEPGDRLREIDGAPLDGVTVEDAASRLRGRVGTMVTLAVERDATGLRRVTLQRASIHVPGTPGAASR